MIIYTADFCTKCKTLKTQIKADYRDVRDCGADELRGVTSLPTARLDDGSLVYLGEMSLSKIKELVR